MATNGNVEHLIAAVATSSRQLKILKVEIQWGGPGSSSEKNTMPQNARLNPALVETHVASASWLYAGPNETNHDASMSELSFLHVLPAVLDNSGSSTVPPLIMTVRSRNAGDGSFQSAQSILDRWEGVESKQGLDSAFEQLGNRRNSVSSDLPNTIKLRKLESVMVSKTVIGIQDIQYGKVIILTMSDGSVEYRDRFTFEEIYTNQDVSKVMNLRQVGWVFSDDGPCKSNLYTSSPFPIRQGTALTSNRPPSCFLPNMLLYDTDWRRWQGAVEQASLPSGRHWQLCTRPYVLSMTIVPCDLTTLM